MSSKKIKKKRPKIKDIDELQKRIRKLVNKIDQEEKDIEKVRAFLEDFQDVT